MEHPDGFPGQGQGDVERLGADDAYPAGADIVYGPGPDDTDAHYAEEDEPAGVVLSEADEAAEPQPSAEGLARGGLAKHEDGTDRDHAAEPRSVAPLPPTTTAAADPRPNVPTPTVAHADPVAATPAPAPDEQASPRETEAVESEHDTTSADQEHAIVGRQQERAAEDPVEVHEARIAEGGLAAARAASADFDEVEDGTLTVSGSHPPGLVNPVQGRPTDAEKPPAPEKTNRERPGAELALPDSLAPAETGGDGGAGTLLAALEVRDRPSGADVVRHIEPFKYLDRNTPFSLGDIEGEKPGTRGGPFWISPADLGHAAAVGASRAGKSRAIQHLARELLRRGSSVIAITPAKGFEWEDTAAKIGLPITIIDDHPDRMPVSLPLAEPVPGYSAVKHLTRVVEIISAFAAAGEEGANMFQKGMLEGTRELLELHGYDYMTGGRREGRRSPPTKMSPEEIRTVMLKRIRDKYDYHPESIAEYVRLRIDPIIEGFGAMFMGRAGHPADIFDLLQSPGLKVINVGKMATGEEDVGLYMSVYLNALWEANEVLNDARAAAAMREQRAILPAPRDTTIILEEAHNVAEVQSIKKMFQEFLAGGTRLVAVDQSAGSLPTEWMENINMIMAFAQPHKDSQEAVASMLPFPAALREDRINALANLPVGQAEMNIRTKEWGSPRRIITPDPDEESSVPVVITYERPRVRDSRVAACGNLCVNSACGRSVINRARSIAVEQERDIASGRVGGKVFFNELFLGAPIGKPPEEFQKRYDTINKLEPQLAECLVAEMVDRIILNHTTSMERADMPADLTANMLANIIRQSLAGTLDSGFRAGNEFVPDVIRVLQEMERVNPFEGHWNGIALGDNDPAPPLLRPIPGVSDTIKETTRQRRTIERAVTVAERRHALANCPGSVSIEKNRLTALGLLMGDDDEASFAKDLALLYPRDSWGQRLNNLSALTGSTPLVRSTASDVRIAATWPSRFLQPETKEVKQQARAGSAQPKKTART